MREPRLLEEGTLATARRRDASAQRLSSLSEADRAEVDRALVHWWSEVLSQDSLVDQVEHVERLRTRCSSLSPELKKLALTAPATLARDSDGVDVSVGARLLGESAAAVVRRATTAIELDRAVRVLADRWEAVEALQEALLRPPPWPASTATLSLAGVPIEDLVGHHFDRVPCSEILLEEESKARESGVSAYFWGRYTELPLNATSVVRLALAARRDWADLATQADALPLRAFRDWLWRAIGLDEDRESILALLRAAPPVFADDVWTGSTGALAALRAAVGHAEKLQVRLAQATWCYSPAPDADAKLKALEDQELPAWLKEVAETAVARSDGRALLILFASTLVRHDLSPPWNGQRSWSASRAALSAMYGSLTPKPSLAECQQTSGVAGVPSNRTSIDSATYLITSATFDADPKQVWGWYRELLLHDDNDLCWQAKSCQRRALCYFALAERLGQLSDPFGEWTGVWNALFVTDRERARFATLDQNAQYPSLHLLRVGAELLWQRPSRHAAEQFFEELLDHTRTLLKNSARRIDPIEDGIALDVLDVAVLIPGCDWRTVVGEYRSLLSSAANRIHVAVVLLEAGASFAEVESTIEPAPHRLRDTVAELKDDMSVRHLTEFVSAAATDHEREQSEGRSAPV